MLCYGHDGGFVGFGDVEVDGVALRHGGQPWQLRVDTPDGILYTRLDVLGLKQDDEGSAELRLQAWGIHWGRQEYRDEYNLELLSPAPAPQPIQDILCIRFEAQRMKVGGRTWHGFSYRFHFESHERRVHRIVSHESWEIGGRIAGNTVLHRGQCNQPVWRGSTDARFQTYCLKTLDQYGSPQGYSFQRGPRGGLIQPFDFQYTADAALWAWWPEYDSISSFLDSPAGCPALRVVDEYRMTLDHSVTTPAKHILLSRGALPEHEAHDLWWEIHEFVCDTIRRRFGVTPSVVKPELRPDRGGDLKRSAIDGQTFRVNVGGERVPADQALYAMADRVVPRMAASGIRRLFTLNVHETDVTRLGLRRKLDDGLDGDLHCASNCATHRFFPSTFWGGIEAWRYLADKAHALGMEIGAWFAPHFSPRAAVFEQHPDWLMRGPDTHPWSGGYGFHTLATADWNTGVYDWVLDDIGRWKEQGGLDYLFTDSWPNLGLLPHNFSNRMMTNAQPLARLYADFQRLGIRTHTFEGISPFGVTHIGVKDLRGDVLAADAGIAGQNDLDWWIGNEDMAYDMCLVTQPRERDAADLERLLFRVMANRGFVNYQGDGDSPSAYDLPEWWARLNHIYNQSLPHMKTRRMLPDDLGVRWIDGDTQIIWAYRDGTYRTPRLSQVEQIESSTVHPLGDGRSLLLKAHCVYRVCSCPSVPLLR